MQRLIQVALSMLIIITSINAQGNNLPKDIIKPGTRLIYEVNYEGAQYEFTISVTNLSDSCAFSWSTGKPGNKSGYLIVSQNAMNNANGFYNYFSNDSGHYINDQCCLTVSQKIFDTFKSNGSMEIYTDIHKKVLAIFGKAYTHTQSFRYQNDVIKEFDCKTVSDGNDYFVTYVNDESFPLIMEMNIGWSMKLKHIYP